MSASTPNTEADTADGDVLDIAVGILRDGDGRVLIAQRRAGTMGAGYWEFPGGKHEIGEAIETTLTRELQEELGVAPLNPIHLVCMRNPAALRPVRLHVWLVTDWHGTPYGREGQRVVWCPQSQLSDWKLLPGNRALLNTLNLPARLGITPDPGNTADSEWFNALDATLAGHVGMLRLRAPTLDDAAYRKLAREVLARAHSSCVPILLDRSADMVEQVGAAGLWWSVDRAADARCRPVGLDCWFGVSAHDADEMNVACRLDADFAVLSPVHETRTHPQRKALGWPGWLRVRSDFGLPVYALGGLNHSELDKARAHNAQGIAAIRAFWNQASAV